MLRESNGSRTVCRQYDKLLAPAVEETVRWKRVGRRRGRARSATSQADCRISTIRLLEPFRNSKEQGYVDINVAPLLRH